MDYIEDAIEQAVAASKPGFTNKYDAVQYYQRQFPSKGKGGWKQSLIQDILPFTPRTGKDPAKNLAKRFDPQRLNTAEPRNDKQYQELAKSLGILKAPPGGYHVHYDGGIQFSECEQREFDIDITGALADEVAADPSRILDIAMQVYMQQEGEDNASVGPCDEEGDPEITVTANPDHFIPREKKRHKSAVPFMKRRL